MWPSQMNVSCLEALPNNQPCQKPVERKTRAAAEHGGEGKASAREVVPERARARGAAFAKRGRAPDVDRLRTTTHEHVGIDAAARGAARTEVSSLPPFA